MKKITLKWKVAKKPERVVQMSASHFTFRTCTKNVESNSHIL